jgi:hypothetical protein
MKLLIIECNFCNCCAGASYLLNVILKMLIQFGHQNRLTRFHGEFDLLK